MSLGGRVRGVHQGRIQIQTYVIWAKCSRSGITQIVATTWWTTKLKFSFFSFFFWFRCWRNKRHFENVPTHLFRVTPPQPPSSRLGNAWPAIRKTSFILPGRLHSAWERILNIEIGGWGVTAFCFSCKCLLFRQQRYPGKCDWIEAFDKKPWMDKAAHHLFATLCCFIHVSFLCLCGAVLRTRRKMHKDAHELWGCS